MQIQEFIDLLQQQKSMSLEERQVAIAKAQVGTPEERKKAVERLQAHYLPLTVLYLEAYHTAFPDQLQNEDDAFEILIDGFLLLSQSLEEYLNKVYASFRSYYKRTIESRINELKKDASKAVEVVPISSEELPYTVDIQSYFYDHAIDKVWDDIDVEVSKMKGAQRSLFERRYGFQGRQPEKVVTISQELHCSQRQLDNFRQHGLQELRENVDCSDRELVYRYFNQRKVIK